MRFLFVLLFLLLSFSGFSQPSPFEGMRIEFGFYERFVDMKFEEVEGRERELKDGTRIQIYKDTKINHETVIAVVEPLEDKYPQIHSEGKYYWGGSNGKIALSFKWDIEESKQSEVRNKLDRYREENGFDSKVSRYDFLPPMKNGIKAHLYFVKNSDYKKDMWPIPEDIVQMKVDLSFPAHPLQSSSNTNSPYHARIPTRKMNLEFHEQYQWVLSVENGNKFISELIPLKK